ncbi:MAG: hypothetical protein CM15mP68_5670 [Pseudomonadota bacterium]|nr:MAG: hypothetical protein CM15mP68_5670 [Pseudomonadota bacterium]
MAALEAAYARDEDEICAATAIHNGDQRPVVMTEADADLHELRADRPAADRAMTEADSTASSVVPLFSSLILPP